MLTNETISKLQDMRLGVMAKQFKEQLGDPQFACKRKTSPRLA